MAEEVVQLKGLRRLVELCKCESARVASDGVLVACLAAVRKVKLPIFIKKYRISTSFITKLCQKS